MNHLVCLCLLLSACASADEGFFGRLRRNVECSDTLPCSRPDRPLCVDGLCAPCRTNRDCEQLNPSEPICQDTPSGTRCAACQRHADCGSGVCITQELASLSGTTGISGKSLGQCAAPETVLRQAGGGPVTPGTAQHYLVLEPDAAAYVLPDPVEQEFAVIGRDRDCEPDSSPASCTVLNPFRIQGGTVLLSNVHVRASRTMIKAIDCSPSVEARLIVSRSVIAPGVVGEAAIGIQASAKCQVELDKTHIDGFAQSGLIAAGTYYISNTLFSRNSASAADYAVLLSGSGKFLLNTITGGYQAISCNNSSQVLLASAIYKNVMNSVDKCMNTCQPIRTNSCGLDDSRKACIVNLHSADSKAMMTTMNLGADDFVLSKALSASENARSARDYFDVERKPGTVTCGFFQ